MSSRIDLAGVGQVFHVRNDESKQMEKFVALADVDLTVEPGEFAGVLADLGGVGHPHTHEFEVGPGVDPGDGMSSDGSGRPLDHAQCHAIQTRTRSNFAVRIRRDAPR